MLVINPINGEDIDSLYKGFKFNTKPYAHNEKNPSWILLGPSGGGKEARGKYLIELFSLKTKLSSGDIFRNKILVGLSKDGIDKLKNEGKKLGDSLKETARDAKAVVKIFNELRIAYRDEEHAVAAFQTLNGLFVDDRILLKYADEQLAECKNMGIVLDGHIRTKDQVSEMIRITRKYGMSIGAALLVHTPISVLERRTVGRLSCPEPGCKRDYNTTNEPGSENFPDEYYEDENGLGWGKCHDHGHKLIRRSDDYPDKVKNRLGQYAENISGVLAALEKAGINVYIVSGNLVPYSKDEMKKSINEALICENEAVIERF